WVAHHSYQECLQKKETVYRESDDAFLKEIINYCEERFGARIKRIMFANIIPDETYKHITTKKYEAERERQRIEIEALATAQRLETEAQGQAKALEAVTKVLAEKGDDARLALAASTLTQGFKDPSSKFFLVGGAESLIRGLVGNLGGNKPPEKKE
ncbi:MAG TPA: hypothetical protein VMC43_00115, partial [Candidatus Paceibacterota bacterium]|nr:hypothetical protein [Candidatus Paceibacterota bacterium]